MVTTKLGLDRVTSASAVVPNTTKKPSRPLLKGKRGFKVQWLEPIAIAWMIHIDSFGDFGSVGIDAQKEIDSSLLLRVDERIGVVPLEPLEHVARVGSPLIDLAVCLHRIDKVRATVLESNRVAKIAVHLRQHNQSITVERSK